MLTTNYLRYKSTLELDYNIALLSEEDKIRLGLVNLDVSAIPHNTIDVLIWINVPSETYVSCNRTKLFDFYTKFLPLLTIGGSIVSLILSNEEEELKYNSTRSNIHTIWSSWECGESLSGVVG